MEGGRTFQGQAGWPTKFSMWPITLVVWFCCFLLDEVWGDCLILQWEQSLLSESDNGLMSTMNTCHCVWSMSNVLFILLRPTNDGDNENMLI